MIGGGMTHKIIYWEQVAAGFVKGAPVGQRSPIRFRAGRGDGWIPVDRGERRKTVEQAFSPYMRLESGTPGPVPGGGLRFATVRIQVKLLRATGLTVELACEKASEALGYPPDYIRRKYYSGPVSATYSFSSEVLRVLDEMARAHKTIFNSESGKDVERRETLARLTALLRLAQSDMDNEGLEVHLQLVREIVALSLVLSPGEDLECL
jgi:hypothetical protein